ncbi:MAG: hypothetical protein E7463_00300 [Ruminococcaceae bacterium]|nr:hypothetical protein [Oscillospiraceae bacterium]
MTERKWYHDSYRRNLIDMHIPDWDPAFFSQIDPKDYVAKLKTANVDTAYIYTTSCVGLCNFPTKVGKMHEGLHGRDIIREITDGCREVGIRPVLYINFWSKWAYDTYPEWRSIAPDGRVSGDYMFGQPGRYGMCCLNSPYGEYFRSLVRELMAGYETDGLWIDMILWRTLCTCPHCRRRFLEETGHELPDTIDMGDPVFVQYLRKREEWVLEFFESIQAIVHAKNPDAAVVCNSTYYPSAVLGMSLDYAQSTEYITGDSNLGPERSFEAKFFNNVTRNHPFEFLCSVMDPQLSEHSMLKTEDHMLQLMTSCLAHNGRNGFIDAIDPSGTLNPAVYEHMRRVCEVTDRYIPFLEPGMEMCADVAIYTNFSNVTSPSDDGKPLHDPWRSDSNTATRNAAARMVEHNIPFDVITPLQLHRLSDFRTIVLPDAYVLEDAEIAALRAYVENGGTLYASGRCAICDNLGGKDPAGRLRDVLGVTITGETSEKLTYIRPEDGTDILPGYTASHPLSCRSFQTLVEASADTKVLGRLTLPWVHPEDTTKFASAISNPPGRHMDNPSLCIHPYGKGTVIYSAAPIENLTGRDHSALFARILHRLTGEDLAFTSDAPHPVEIVVYRQKESGNYVINLTNSLLPVLTLPDITLRVRIPEPIKSLYTAPDRRGVPYTREGDYIRITLPRMHVFEMIIAEV